MLVVDLVDVLEILPTKQLQTPIIFPLPSILEDNVIVVLKLVISLSSIDASVSIVDTATLKLHRVQLFFPRLFFQRGDLFLFLTRIILMDDCLHSLFILLALNLYLHCAVVIDCLRAIIATVEVPFTAPVSLVMVSSSWEFINIIFLIILRFILQWLYTLIGMGLILNSQICYTLHPQRLLL